MRSLLQSKEELESTLKGLALGYAQADYRRKHHGCPEEQSGAWAEAHWQEWDEAAVNLLAALEARREQTLAN